MAPYTRYVLCVEIIIISLSFFTAFNQYSVGDILYIYMYIF